MWHRNDKRWGFAPTSASRYKLLSFDEVEVDFSSMRMPRQFIVVRVKGDRRFKLLSGRKNGRRANSCFGYIKAELYSSGILICGLIRKTFNVVNLLNQISVTKIPFQIVSPWEGMSMGRAASHILRKYVVIWSAHGTDESFVGVGYHFVYRAREENMSLLRMLRCA